MSRVFLFIPLFFLALSHAWAQEDPAPWIDGIRKHYGNQPGLTTDYTREVITRTMSMLGGQVKGDLATGRLHFMPPHFLKLEQETPEPETLVTNGNTLWWVVPEKRRVYKYPAKKFGRELKLLGDILQGLTKVEASFTLTMLEPADQGEARIELKPDPPWEQIDRIVLHVAGKKIIRGVDIHNQMGGITRFRLGSRFDVKRFDASFFTFVVPEGVQLIEEGY